VSAPTGDNSVGFDRRRFLANAAAMSVTPLLYISRTASAEAPPETKAIRLVHNPAICLAPQYLAKDLLHVEGFSDVTYVEVTSGEQIEKVYRGEADLTMEAAPVVVHTMDRQPSVVALAGIHAGCVEVIGSEKVQTLRDLKGKSVVVFALDGADHILLASMLAYVGMNPDKDVHWLAAGGDLGPMKAFMEGKADAFIGVPPQPQELRAKKIGRTIIDTAQDRPWSQYFCCMVVAGRSFVTRYPVATKRALRALLKGADMCAQQPERVARFLAEKRFASRYELGLEVLKSLPYNRWREANPEDTLRFNALRLHEVGMIKSDPNHLLARSTDWRFLNELKRELKT
jgi:NitT/TauT family transport system substrate-binding protein